jgi:hypothetical protein
MLGDRRLRRATMKAYEINAMKLQAAGGQRRLRGIPGYSRLAIWVPGYAANEFPVIERAMDA